MAYFTARRTLASSLFRALYSSSSSSSAIAYRSRSRSRFALAIHANQTPLGPHSVNVPIRFQTSESAKPPLNDSTTNSSSSAPKGTIILEGCDLEHWLIIMEFPENPKPSEEEMVNTYVKTLAEVVGSEEEAKKKIYSVSTTTYKGFGALISEELSAKVKGLPGVLWVLPDSYLDVPNKDYGGDLFVDGKVIPRPKYRFTEKQSTDNKSGPQNNRRNERRQSSQRHNRSQGQREPMQQSAPNNIHNSASGGEA